MLYEVERGQGPHGTWIRWEPLDPALLKGGVSSYFIHCPTAHPAWDWFMLDLIHLRPVPGLPIAKKISPENTHEVVAFAVDPDSYNEEPVPLEVSYLNPYNLNFQFAAAGDVEARWVVSLAVQAVVDGRLAIEPPFGPVSLSNEWRLIVNATIAHHSGEHPG